MNKNYLIKKTIEKTVEQFCSGNTKISLTTDIYKDMNGDDLDVVEIIMELEDEFDIFIEDPVVFDNVLTLKDIVDIFQSRLHYKDIVEVSRFEFMDIE